MTTYRLQHAFQGRSGDAKDTYVNTFHFIGTPSNEATALAALAEAVKDFYAWPLTWMSNFALGPGRTIKVYDLSDPVDSANGVTRPTHYEEIQFTEVGSNAGKDPLPEEVAVCLSFEGLTIAGGNRARRRGRLYIGPFNTDALDGADSNAQCFVNNSLATSLTSGASQLMTDALAAGFTWCIHSTVNNNDVTLARVWVDNSFDTVRGRGKPATARVVVEGAPFDEP